MDWIVFSALYCSQHFSHLVWKYDIWGTQKAFMQYPELLTPPFPFPLNMGNELVSYFLLVSFQISFHYNLLVQNWLCAAVKQES